MSLITTPTNLDYLITPLRLHLNDNSSPYTYSDDELRTRLVYAVKALMPRWNYRYLINDSTNNVYRNPHCVFLFSSPPIIQHGDERPIILQAAIDIKVAVVYTNSQTAGTWKDEEISYSNVEGIRVMKESLNRDIEELNALLPVGRKRLAQPVKQSLPGFMNPPNVYEG